MIASGFYVALAFDLICSGMLRSGPVGLALPEENGEPFSIAYRIDLDARRWCSDDCRSVEEVSEIFEGQIVLHEAHSPEGSHVIRFEPASRHFDDTEIVGDVATLRSGRCDVAPFTGFPSPAA